VINGILAVQLLFSIYHLVLFVFCGMRLHILLRHCATSWKVTGSIPDRLTRIFHWHNPSGHTMALGLTQPLTELSTRNNFWGCKGGPVHTNDNLTTFMCRLAWNLGASTSWNPHGLSRPAMGLLYLCLYLLQIRNVIASSLCYRTMTSV
jgi:hypothetical protein